MFFFFFFEFNIYNFYEYASLHFKVVLFEFIELRLKLIFGLSYRILPIFSLEFYFSICSIELGSSSYSCMVVKLFSYFAEVFSRYLKKNNILININTLKQFIKLQCDSRPQVVWTTWRPNFLPPWFGCRVLRWSWLLS